MTSTDSPSLSSLPSKRAQFLQSATGLVHCTPSCMLSMHRSLMHVTPSAPGRRSIIKGRYAPMVYKVLASPASRAPFDIYQGSVCNLHLFHCYNGGTRLSVRSERQDKISSSRLSKSSTKVLRINLHRYLLILLCPFANLSCNRMTWTLHDTWQRTLLYLSTRRRKRF